MKKRVGFFSFTCCEGCIVVFIECLNRKYEEWSRKMNIVNCRILKKFEKIESMDIAFVEGAISTESEIKKLKEIRRKSKKLIALGSGAATGFPSNQRNNFNPEVKRIIKPLFDRMKQIEEISPLEKFVNVDDKIIGCPVDEDTLINKIDSLLKDA